MIAESVWLGADSSARVAGTPLVSCVLVAGPELDRSCPLILVVHRLSHLNLALIVLALEGAAGLNHALDVLPPHACHPAPSMGPESSWCLSPVPWLRSCESWKRGQCFIETETQIQAPLGHCVSRLEASPSKRRQPLSRFSLELDACAQATGGPVPSSGRCRIRLTLPDLSQSAGPPLGPFCFCRRGWAARQFSEPAGLALTIAVTQCSAVEGGVSSSLRVSKELGPARHSKRQAVSFYPVFILLLEGFDSATAERPL